MAGPVTACRPAAGRMAGVSFRLIRESGYVMILADAPTGCKT